jgi:uncharacterized protein YndB with AHSA1/START domain
MGRVRVGTTVAASPRQVWAHIADVRAHAEWMRDAEAIRLVAGTANRVGATYEVDTHVGPIRLLDVVEVTEWDEAKAMGVRHVGMVTGTGRFTLEERDGGTRFVWDEELVFPWWMGGPVGAVVGGWFLKQVWKRNLRTLKRAVETGS